ncbi:MAG TPA: division/cell wall cluster transcriptional repressor MraZ [Bacteroidetes bacterium]|nr:division/cell wall cluster transcriptional repressor MraZ [Bacteroidota bacterium]
MRPIFGEYECKIDAKGRFVLPSGLRKQLPEDEQKEFVINRGLDQCLVLYPIKVWERELSKIHARNQYVAKNRAFARKFQNGAKPVEIDNAGRVLVPKQLSGYAGVSKELVLVASFDRIEIWDKLVYDAWQSDEQWDMETLSEEVMGGLQEGSNEN